PLAVRQRHRSASFAGSYQCGCVVRIPDLSPARMALSILSKILAITAFILIAIDLAMIEAIMLSNQFFPVVERSLADRTILDLVIVVCHVRRRRTGLELRHCLFIFLCYSVGHCCFLR